MRAHCAGGGDHRGQRTLHVDRTPAVEAALALDGLEGPVHPLRGDRVEVAVEQQPASPALPPQRRDDVRPAVGGLDELGLQPEVAADRRYIERDLPFARGAGN